MEQEWDNLTHLIRRAIDEGRYAAALELFLPIVHFLDVWGSWDERVQLGREMCQVAHKLGDPVEAWLWIDAIGYILHERRQFSECIQALEAGRLLAHQYGLDDAYILANIFEAGLYTRIRKIDLAEKKIEEVLKQLDLDSVVDHGTLIRRLVATRATDELAFLGYAKKDHIRTKKWFEIGLNLRRLTGENTAPTLLSLADVCLKLDEVELAEKYPNASIGQC